MSIWNCSFIRSMLLPHSWCLPLRLESKNNFTKPRSYAVDSLQSTRGRALDNRWLSILKQKDHQEFCTWLRAWASWYSPANIPEFCWIASNFQYWTKQPFRFAIDTGLNLTNVFNFTSESLSPSRSNPRRRLSIPTRDNASQVADMLH